ncbi:MAG: cyclic nucleotide-binding domain-containing protein [Treponema sp.]|nr:cyclic nucleotide-binding domain-containing protein [Treponema sp.]
MKLHMKLRSPFFKNIIQFFTLVCSLFVRNDLLIYAAAGAYGFLCSLVPIIMLIAGILIRFFKTTPDVIINMLSQTTLMQTFDLNNIFNSIFFVRRFGIFEIIITIFILWMARRFFSYLTRGFRQIFRDGVVKSPMFISVIAFSAEVLLVLGVALLIFVLNVFQSFINFTGLISYIPWFLKKSGELFLRFLTFGIMSIVIMLFYYFITGSKPKLLDCAIASVCCTFTFWVFNIIFHLFLNMGRYNIVYGVLSNLIVLLLEVYVFFMLLLFFAECIFVKQFYNILVFEQIYLLPPKNTKQLSAAFIRSVFQSPEFFIASELLELKKNEPIFSKNSKSECIYYIASGTVSYFENNHIEYFSAGSFFGEIDCLTKRKRHSTAIAETDARLFCVSYDDFKELLNFSPEAGKKMVKTMNSFYLRTSVSRLG